MGLLDFWKGKSGSAPPAFPAALGAPARGKFVPMEEIPDEVFSAGVLGRCCGVEPEVGNVYAPVSGTISQLADTLHAVGIEADGMEVLIHVGVDTVEMNGEGFHSTVKLGQRVQKGDLLLTMDVEKIHAAGHPATVIMAVTNSDEFSAVEACASGAVQPGVNVMQVNQ